MNDDRDLFTGIPFLKPLPDLPVFLLCLTSLAGAAFFAMQVPATEPAVVLPSAALAIATGLLGLELRFRKRAGGPGKEGTPEETLDIHSVPAHISETCLALVERLEEAEEGEAREEIKKALDEIQIGALDPVIERRAAIIHQFGMVAFARFMSAFSRGERLLHRAWSALTDGHEPEASRSLRAAAAAFAEVPPLHEPNRQRG